MMTAVTTLTDQSDALNYLEGLFGALAIALTDTEHTLEITDGLKVRGLSPTFPEVRFCKGCVLPVVDTFTTRFLEQQFGANRSTVRSSLRCEGFQTLDQYYSRTENMSGYIGSPWTRDRTTVGKAGGEQLAGANPDFCVRFNAPRSLRVVGEVKFLPTQKTSARGLEKIKDELRHYLSIKSSSHSDWGHDFGFGLMYCGSGRAPRRAELLVDAWCSDRIMVAYFHA